MEVEDISIIRENGNGVIAAMLDENTNFSQNSQYTKFINNWEILKKLL